MPTQMAAIQAPCQRFSMYGARFDAPTGSASRWSRSSSRLEQALTSSSPEKAVVPRTTRRTRLGSCRPTESPLSEYDELPETLLLDGPTATARLGARVVRVHARDHHHAGQQPDHVLPGRQG